MMIDYIANIYRADSVTKEYTNYDDLTSMANEREYNIFVRDAFIDALGLIGKTFPASIGEAIPLLEHLATNSSSPYTIKKAKKVLDIINRKQ